MIPTGPFQDLPFCDYVILWFFKFPYLWKSHESGVYIPFLYDNICVKAITLCTLKTFKSASLGGGGGEKAFYITVSEKELRNEAWKTKSWDKIGNGQL